LGRIYERNAIGNDCHACKGLRIVIDVAGLLDGVIPRKSVTVRSFDATTIDSVFGTTVPGASADTVETLPMHPADRRMIDRMIGADHRRETIALYAPPTSALVRASSSADPQVQVDGRWYERVSIADYGEQGGILIVLASLLDSVSA
jgi:hypothetical protein